MLMKKPRVLLMTILVVLAGAGLWGWTIIRRGFSARDNPSALEAYVALKARKLAVPATYRTLKNPFQATPDSVQAGLEHFADHCAVCHANSGSGDTDFGRNMYPKPPDMRQADTQDKTDGELYYIIQNGIRLSGMPAFGEKDRTDDESTWKLVAFIRHLPALTPAEEKEMLRLNPKSAADREEEEFLRGESPPAKSSKPHHH